MPHATTPTVTLYTRPDCHLCDVMKRKLARVGRRIPFALQEVDISADAELERRYGHDIPVLLVAGREVARHGIDERELVRALTGT